MRDKPTTVSELQEMVQTAVGELCPRGGGSKPALSTAPPGQTTIEMSGLSGILEYEPGEYTFTAYAGTAVSDIAAALAEHGQYLPFDPLLVGQGATLGGTVAANSAGSGRYRYGGVRDFILGARFIDGQGQLVRSGGKVVKNAAGFDLSKFMVGSLGRYGLLVELTFKVFPQPRAYATLRLTYAHLAAALAANFRLATRPFELDAWDLQPQADGRCQMLLRLGGLPDTDGASPLAPRLARLHTFLAAETNPTGDGEIIGGTAPHATSDQALWQEANRLAWVPPDSALVKIPLAPTQLLALDGRLESWPRRYTAGGNVAWVATPDLAALHAILTDLGLVGLQFTGGTHGPFLGQHPFLGQRKGLVLAQRVKRALDPNGRFSAHC